MGACCCGPTKSEEDATTIVADPKDAQQSAESKPETESKATEAAQKSESQTYPKAKEQDASQAKSSEKSSRSSSSSSRSRSKVDPNAEHELIVRIMKGRNLPASKGSDACDSYVVVHAEDKKYQSSVCKNSSNPNWDDSIVITQVGILTRLKELKFDLFSKNGSESDQLLGSWRLKFSCELKSCVTPAVWYSVRDASGKSVSSAEVQVQLQFRSDTRVMWAENYTHVLELTVLSARGLRDMDWMQSQGRPQREPYVSVEVGRQAFRASTQKKANLSNVTAPVWNEPLYLLVDDTRNRDWQMVISVLDRDLRVDDRIGTAYLPLRAIYDARDIYNRPFEGQVILQPRMVNLDRGLRSIRYKGRDKKGQDVGRLLLRGRLIKREEVELKLCERLVEGLDKKGDGKLQKSDVRQVLSYLELNMDAKAKKDKVRKQMEKFMKKSDKGVVAREEVMQWVTQGKIGETESTVQLLQYHLRHPESEDILTEKLMDGVLGRSGVWGESD